jgi:hypothetical protein
MVGDVTNPEEPGHDLNDLARNGLVPGRQILPTLYADMGGSLLASEAILSVALAIQRQLSFDQYTLAIIIFAFTWLQLRIDTANPFQMIQRDTCGSKIRLQRNSTCFIYCFDCK